MRFQLLLTAAALVATSANAITVQYRTTNQVAGQGYVSPFANARGGSNPAGLGEERFNSLGALGTCKLQRSGLFKYGAFGNDNPAGPMPTSNGLATAVGRAPLNHLPPGTNGATASTTPPSEDIDQSCYAYGPYSDPALPAGGSLQPYAIALTHTNARYLGFYLGSIDPYNNFTLVSPNGTPLVIAGLGDQALGTFNGQQLVDYLNIAKPGVTLYSSQFIEFFLAPTERIGRINVGSNGSALEFDNLTFSIKGLSPTGTYANPTGAITAKGSPAFASSSSSASFAAIATPEPLTVGVMLSGIGMLGFARRKRTR